MGEDTGGSTGVSAGLGLEAALQAIGSINNDANDKDANDAHGITRKTADVPKNRPVR